MPPSTPLHRLKRQARQLARDQSIPLHRALDAIARERGYRNWGHLSARQSAETAAPPSPAQLLDRLAPGELVLLAARPGQGKTRLGLDLLTEAARRGHRTIFFTLEFTEAESRAFLRGPQAHAVEVVAEDDISAATIAARLAGAAPGTLAVVDYLQLLDQRRDMPPLAEQVVALHRLAAETGTIIAMLSQIDRRFDPAAKRLPGLADLRLPNPVDLTLFAKACFLADGQVRLDAVA